MTKVDEEEDIGVLSRGLPCIKYAENGLKPHEKRLHFDGRRNWLIWTDVADPATYNYIRVSDIKDVQDGRQSPGFMKYGKEKPFTPEL